MQTAARGLIVWPWHVAIALLDLWCKLCSATTSLFDVALFPTLQKSPLGKVHKRVGCAPRIPMASGFCTGMLQGYYNQAAE